MKAEGGGFNEKLRRIKVDRLHFGGDGAWNFDPNLFAQYSDHCHLLHFSGGDGDCHRKIGLKGGADMQVVVVKAPRFLRGILKRAFKIRN